MQRVCTSQADLPLLCERCGYEVESLPAGAVCPECGSDIDAARTGSRWQRAPSIASWLQTNMDVMIHPLQTLAQLVPERVRSVRLLILNSMCAGVLFAAVPMLPGPSQSAMRTQLTHSSSDRVEFIVSTVAVVTVPMILVFLSLTEGIGLRLLGKRKGWRITRDVATSIVSHASVGWIVGAMLTAVLMLVANVISDNAMRHATGQSRLPLMFLPATAAIVGPGCSLLLFETLAYIGMRRCKYANLPRSSKQAV